MSDAQLDAAARAVLSQYVLSGSSLRPLGNLGGFSGAALWRVQGPDGDWCLRAWPANELDCQRIRDIHFLMRRARDKGLAFVPGIRTTEYLSTWVEETGRLWELTTWMPGVAAIPGLVRREQVEAAFAALAILHKIWVPILPEEGTCPGVFRRLEAIREWDEEIQIALQSPGFATHRKSPAHLRNQGITADPIDPWAARAWQLLQVHADKIRCKLGPWFNRQVPLQPCLCDIWHDHVLFEGDVVSGLVDYGGVKTDHVAVDLARLLGSLVEDRFDLRAAGLEAYTRIRPLSLQEEELVSVLDQTGTVVGLITWLKWLYFEDKQLDDRKAAARRLQALVERVERWK